jgi:hypothetical protein
VHRVAAAGAPVRRSGRGRRVRARSAAVVSSAVARDEWVCVQREDVDAADGGWRRWSS